MFVRAAALEGHTACCLAKLMDYGADGRRHVDKWGDEFRSTLLMNAICFNHDEAVALLLSRGANPSPGGHSRGGRRGSLFTGRAPERVQWWGDGGGESQHFLAKIFVAAGGLPGSFVVGFGERSKNVNPPPHNSSYIAP